MVLSGPESGILDICGTKHGWEVRRFLGRLISSVTKFSLTGRLRILPFVDLASDMSSAIASQK